MSLTNQFKNKIAVITGSTQGIGEAAARLYVERGIEGIVICGRNKTKGERISDDLTTETSKCFFIESDLEKLEDCHAIIKFADEKFGRIDILVNCAACAERGTILSTTHEIFDQLINVNLRAPFFLIQDTVKIMRREKTPGTIVSISSMQAYGGFPFLTPYAASKAGLVVLTKNVANALSRDRIRINAINMGWADTPGETATQKRFHNSNDYWLEEAEKDMPFGRLVKPVEIARAIAYLTSEESGLMTGSIIDFDQSVDGTHSQAYSTPRLNDTLLGK